MFPFAPGAFLATLLKTGGGVTIYCKEKRKRGSADAEETEGKLSSIKPNPFNEITKLTKPIFFSLFFIKLEIAPRELVNSKILRFNLKSENYILS